MMPYDDVINEAKKVFDIEIESLSAAKESLSESFEAAVALIHKCRGKISLCGVGKSGHIARKISATLSSLGCPSFFMHPDDAQHGDLGMLCKDDVVVLISFSGESDEIISIVPIIKVIGAKIISITGNANSTIAKSSDVNIALPDIEEACHLKIAPTSSATCTLVLGDAMAIVASKLKGVSKEDFALVHPSGALGKSLILKARDVVSSYGTPESVPVGATLVETICAIGKHKHGVVAIVNGKNEVVGVFSDGDLRRLLEKKHDIYRLNVEEVMTKQPLVFSHDVLAVQALVTLRERSIFAAPIIDETNKFIGIISVNDILSVGIVG